MSIRIFAVAGGGGEAMDDYLFDDLLHKKNPRVCYIPTASGDDFDSMREFWAQYRWRCGHIEVLELFNRKIEDLDEYLSGFDMIYVGGGNTVNLLAVWRAQKVTGALVVAGARGTLLAGCSAGALCWFSGGLTDSYGPGYEQLSDGVGLLPYEFCPHMNHAGRKAAFLKYPPLTPAFGAEDHVGLYFEDGKLVEAVSSFPGPKAISVSPEGTVRKLWVRPLSTIVPKVPNDAARVL